MEIHYLRNHRRDSLVLERRKGAYYKLSEGSWIFGDSGSSGSLMTLRSAYSLLETGNCQRKVELTRLGRMKS